jgi:uncharacterized membrane protein
MAQRIAGVLSLLAFAVCLVVGTLQAGNDFGTTVYRALAAMAVTLVIGLVVGAMAQRMIDENISSQNQNSGNVQNNSESSDR